jgi:hypothetical protein
MLGPEGDQVADRDASEGRAIAPLDEGAEELAALGEADRVKLAGRVLAGVDESREGGELRAGERDLVVGVAEKGCASGCGWQYPRSVSAVRGYVRESLTTDWSAGPSWARVTMWTKTESNSGRASRSCLRSCKPAPSNRSPRPCQSCAWVDELWKGEERRRRGRTTMGTGRGGGGAGAASAEIASKTTSARSLMLEPCVDSPESKRQSRPHISTCCSLASGSVRGGKAGTTGC